MVMLKHGSIYKLTTMPAQAVIMSLLQEWIDIVKQTTILVKDILHPIGLICIAQVLF